MEASGWRRWPDLWLLSLTQNSFLEPSQEVAVVTPSPCLWGRGCWVLMKPTQIEGAMRLMSMSCCSLPPPPQMQCGDREKDYIHLRIFQALPVQGGQVELCSFQLDKTKDDPITYF